MLRAIAESVAAAVGCLLLYVAFFLSPAEDGRLHNSLEQLWRQIEAAQAAALSVQAAFLNGIAIKSSAALDSLFGTKLLSVRAISISLSLSIASALLVLLVLNLKTLDLAGWLTLLGISAVLLTALLVFLSIPVFYKWAPWLPLALVVGFSAVMLGMTLLVDNDTDTAYGLLEIDVILLCSTLADFFSITVGRRLLNTVGASSDSVRMFLLLFGTLALPACFVALPLVFISANKSMPFVLVTFLGVFAYSNILSGLVSSVFVLLSAIALLHRLIWPFLRRPVMAANRHGLLEQRKLLGGVGLGLLTFNPFGRQLVDLFRRHFL